MFSSILKALSNLWNDIKKAFSSALSKWVGGAVFMFLATVIWSGTTGAKKIYDTPKKLAELKDSSSAKFEKLFDNDNIQESNQKIMADKIDSLIEVIRKENETDDEFRDEARDMFSEIRQQLYKK